MALNFTDQLPVANFIQTFDVHSLATKIQLSTTERSIARSTFPARIFSRGQFSFLSFLANRSRWIGTIRLCWPLKKLASLHDRCATTRQSLSSCCSFPFPSRCFVCWLIQIDTAIAKPVSLLLLARVFGVGWHELGETRK